MGAFKQLATDKTRTEMIRELCIDFKTSCPDASETQCMVMLATLHTMELEDIDSLYNAMLKIKSQRSVK